MALIAVCGKCAGDPRALRTALKRELKARAAGKTVRVVKTSCLGICPKRATAVAVAESRVDDGAPGTAGLRYFVIARDADPEEVLAVFGDA